MDFDAVMQHIFFITDELLNNNNINIDHEDATNACDNYLRAVWLLGLVDVKGY